MTNTIDSQEIISGIENVPDLKHYQLIVNGGPMSIYQAGNSNKPIVVMLHGSMYDESRFIWDQMFPFLSKYYQLYALDIPRHGKSRPWEGIMNHSRLMDILNCTFEQLKIKSFSLVGLSMGGGLSIEYASLYPDKVKSMVLFEPGGLGDKVDMQFITWLYIKFPGMLRRLSQKYMKQDHSYMKKILESLFVDGSKPKDPDRLTSILVDEVKGKHMHGENDMDDWLLHSIGPFRLKWNLLDRIPKIKCSTLWIRGADSVLVKQYEMERAVKLARSGGFQAELCIIQNAGHLLPLEQPEQVNTVVKAFLDKMKNY
ncbi:MAG: alpha/beta hydrolase [Desulfitobacteriaceae bacterium]|nr:alpha/beta hydrolase [Desulfitobacteriaceae bacterium]